SAQRVFFDNLVIHHNRGPILQTDNYYPFGLTMAGISDQAALSLENNYLFNGKLLNHKKFSDNTGLDWYSYGMREYDPQIGRFFRVDPLTEKYPWWTPYQFTGNNPVKYIDLDGLEPAYYNWKTHTLVGAGDILTHRVPQEDLKYLPSGSPRQLGPIGEFFMFTV
ncbi:MAG: RHS repeat domain-containing protein, partial [Chitinophagaceae bacterium]